MQVLNSIQQLKQLIPSNKIIGGTTFQKKNIGELHLGHSHLIQKMKEKCEIIVLSFQEPAYTLDCLFFKKQPQSSKIWNESYCVDWAEEQGVDYVFIPPDDFLVTLAHQVDFDSIKNSVENIILNENYNRLISEFYLNHLRYVLSTMILCKQLDCLYPKNYHFCGLEQIPIPLIRKHFAKKYGYPEVILVESLKRPDGLPYSTSLLKLNQQKIDVLVNINNSIKEVFFGVSSNADISLINLNSLCNGMFTVQNFSTTNNEVTEYRDYVSWSLCDVDTNLIYNFGELF
jgi:hypothetical protein